MQRTPNCLLTAAVPLVLSACGGGGSSGDVSAAAPTIQLSAAAAQVSRGKTTTLSWTSTDTTQCTASGAWSGAKAVSGNETVTVTANTSNYSLSCSGRGGSVSASTTVTGLNDSPVATGSLADQTVTISKPLASADLRAVFSDPNGDALTVTATRSDGAPLPAWLRLGSTGVLTGTPGWGDVGALALKVTASDGHGGNATVSLAVNVEYLRHQTCAGERIEDTGLPNGPVQMGEYIPVNSYGTDMWNRYPGFGACATAEHIGPQTVRAEWSWQIPLPPNYDDSSRFPFGFPSIVYGIGMMPWQTYDTTNVLPVAVKDFPDLKVAMDLSINYDDQSQLNTLLDVIVVPDPSNLKQMVDLMIIPMTVRVPQNRNGQTLVRVGDLDYWVAALGHTQPHFWYPDDPTSYLRSTQFVVDMPFTSATVRIKPFLDYALAQGWIQPSDVVINIQFGVEPNAGSGSAALRSFSITSDP